MYKRNGGKLGRKTGYRKPEETKKEEYHGVLKLLRKGKRRKIRNEGVFKRIAFHKRNFRYTRICVKSIKKAFKVCKKLRELVKSILVDAPVVATPILKRHQNGVEINAHVKN